MRNFPPFHLGQPVPPELYIDRAEELRQIEWALATKRHVLVYGQRRIGKTSTLRKIHRVLEESNSNRKEKTFEAYLHYFMESYADLLALFKHLVLDICVAVLVQQYGVELPLIEAHQPKDLKDSIVRERRVLLDIYQALKSNRTISLADTSKAGLEFYAVGTKEATETTQFKDITPDHHDLQQMLDVILSILKKSKYTSVVLFIDDINGNLERLLSKEGTQLLQILSEKSVIIVASVFEQLLQKPVQNLAFLDTVRLGGFKSSNDVRELLAVYTAPPHYDGPRVEFSDEIIELIWKTTNGHPQFVQEVCYRCFDEALSSGLSSVSREMVYKHSLELIRRSPQLYN